MKKVVKKNCQKRKKKLSKDAKAAQKSKKLTKNMLLMGIVNTTHICAHTHIFDEQYLNNS